MRFDKVLVTGGSGQLGAFVVAELLDGIADRVGEVLKQDRLARTRRRFAFQQLSFLRRQAPDDPVHVPLVGVFGNQHELLRARRRCSPFERWRDRIFLDCRKAGIEFAAMAEGIARQSEPTPAQRLFLGHPGKR